jgi:hypothetical protein
MSIAVSSTGQRPVVAAAFGWLMAIVAVLAIALAGVVAVNQTKPGEAAAQAAGSVAAPREFRLAPGNLTPPGIVNPADSLSSYDAAIVAAAQARAQGEANSAYDAAIVAAAQARAQGEANQARGQSLHRATAQ